MLARMQRNWITHTLLERMPSGTATQNRSVTVPYKPNMCLLYNPAISLLGIHLRDIKTCSHKNLYMNVDSRFIHSSWRLETTQCPSMGEYLHYGISIPWTTTQQEKGTKDWYVQQLRRIPKELCWVTKSDIYKYTAFLKGHMVELENRLVVARG